jgi:hypothetical protein
LCFCGKVLKLKSRVGHYRDVHGFIVLEEGELSVVNADRLIAAAAAMTSSKDLFSVNETDKLEQIIQRVADEELKNSLQHSTGVVADEKEHEPPEKKRRGRKPKN